MKNSILYKGLVCGLILLFLTACSTDKSKVDGGYKPGIMYNGEIYWLDEDDSNTTSINEEYVLIGEVNEDCDNDLQKPTNDLQVTNSLIEAIGSKVYYNEKDDKISIYNKGIKEYIYYK